MKYFLDVPYAEKNEAKKRGAKWDEVKRLWFFTDHRNYESLQRWMPAIDPLAIARRRTESKNERLSAPIVIPDGALIFHTDGSCHPNPGPGGWAVVCSDKREVYQGVAEATNNRMELLAVIEAMKMSYGATCVIYTDSQYVQQGITVWMPKWKRLGWVRKAKGGTAKTEVKNLDLWQEADMLMTDAITVRWVRGHNGDPGNERADVLAGLGRLSLQNN